MFFLLLSSSFAPEDTGSTIPSRVDTLDLRTQVEFGACSRLSLLHPLSETVSISISRHQLSPELIRSRNTNSVPMMFTAESPPAQGQ